MNKCHVLTLLIFATAFTAYITCVFYLRYPAWFYLIGIIQGLKYPVSQYLEYDWTFDKSDLVSKTHHANKPNIILIIADDLGINDLSKVSTPNIDSIYLNGRNLVNAYAGQATCAPSRAAIFTGRYPTRFGFEFTPVPAPFSYAMAKAEGKVVRKGIYHAELASQVPSMKKMIVPFTEKLTSQLLKPLGYDTVYIGKWHMGESEGAKPQDRGFDKFVGFLPGASLYKPIGSPDVIDAVVDGEPTDDFLRTNAVFAVVDDKGNRFAPNEYMTDYLGHQAAAAIASQAAAGRTNSDKDRISSNSDSRTGSSRSSRTDSDNSESNNSVSNNSISTDSAEGAPLFMVVSFNAPHNPYQALRSDYDHPEIAGIPNHIDRVYGAMIRALDRAVGVVLEAVRTHHPDNGRNTLVIFTSDNGGVMYTGLSDVNTPYRGGKGTFFEGGVRVPMFVQWPKMLPKRTNSNYLGVAAHLDIFSTVVAAAGVSTEDFPEVVDGVDLIPFLQADDIVADISMQECLVSDSQQCEAGSSAADRSDATASDRIPHIELYWRSGHYMSIMQSGWKLQIAQRPNKIWLYDLLSDPTEQRDLAREINPDGIAMLKKKQSGTDLPGTYTQYEHYDSSEMSSSNNTHHDGLMQQCLDVVSGTVENSVSHNSITAETTVLLVSTQLCTMMDRLLYLYTYDMVPPLWPSLSEIVMAVDGTTVTSLEEEYVFWQN